MPKRDSRQVLISNVTRLMEHHWEGINTSKLGREIKSHGGAQRIMAGASVGPDILDRTAKCFGLKTWQLLVPNLEPADPPSLALSADEKKSIERLRAAARQVAQLETEPGQFPALTE